MKILNLGCGLKHMIGAINIDAYENAKPDILHDLNITPWPFENDSIDAIFASHIFEHLTNWWGAFEECGRILKAGGTLEIATPDASSDSALAYRDHYQVFMLYSFHGAFTHDQKPFRHGSNAWAVGVAGSVPLKIVRYEQHPHGCYDWMCSWPFRWLLKFCAVHMRNFIWEQVFYFEKIQTDRGMA